MFATQYPCSSLHPPPLILPYLQKFSVWNNNHSLYEWFSFPSRFSVFLLSYCYVLPLVTSSVFFFFHFAICLLRFSFLVRENLKAKGRCRCRLPTLSQLIPSLRPRSHLRRGSLPSVHKKKAEKTSMKKIVTGCFFARTGGSQLVPFCLFCIQEDLVRYICRQLSTALRCTARLGRWHRLITRKKAMATVFSNGGRSGFSSL